METQKILANRYQLLSKLGEGGSGITYQGKDLTTGETVAIKVLSLHQIEDWKKLDYFEREVKILQQLNHPRIPQYIAYFVHDSQENIDYPLVSSDDLTQLIEQGIQPDQFYIIQEFIQGQSFESLVQNGWKAEETEAKNIASQILTILIYLQDLIPPITHRDLKPQNLIYTENKEVFLVDFGAVQDRIRQTTVASSVVGTYGYMSPEQLRGGKTYPCTDLYGLGATLIYLLTGKHPAELPQKRLKIDFHKEVNISSAFRQWIDKLIEPKYQNRLPSAQIALDILQGKTALNTQQTFSSDKPKNSSLKLRKTEEELTLIMPAAFSRQRWNYLLGILAITFYLLFCLSFFHLMISFAYTSFIFFIPLTIYGFLVFVRIIYVNDQLILPSLFSRVALRIFVLLLLFLFLASSIHNSLIFSMIVSVIVAIPSASNGKKIQNLIQELIFHTTLKIRKDRTVIIERKLSFFPLQTLSSDFDQKQLNYQFMRLLTQPERKWVNQQIEQFKFMNHES